MSLVGEGLEWHGYIRFYYNQYHQPKRRYFHLVLKQQRLTERHYIFYHFCNSKINNGTGKPSIFFIVGFLYLDHPFRLTAAVFRDHSESLIDERDDCAASNLIDIVLKK